jgi:hypothetical protein
VEQWDRVQRWYERFHELTTGQAENQGTAYVQDVAYAFFQNSHHLKDWLKVSHAVDKNDVEDFVRQARWLSIGGALCNATKHLGRDNRAGAKETRVTGGNIEILAPAAGVFRRPDGSWALLDQRGGSIRTGFTVTSGGEDHDALDIASGCMQEWWDYLRRKGLTE